MFRKPFLGFEILLLSALILATRCANYQDVFVDRNIYFTDADCYSRMTRVRICAEHPGTIVRHHDFENFPQGTTPHTTAPLDYLIVGLASLLKPFTVQSLDLAGAFISPLFALIGGWFLWWWSGWMNFRYRWVLLILYGISPILVHGTELGRPDHQSLLMLLITVGVCAEWSLTLGRSRNWSIVSGIAWGVALWVSLYEPLILLAILFVSGLTRDRSAFLGPDRRIGWGVFGGVILIGLLVERRIPVSLSIFHADPFFQSWCRSIGELAHISPINRIWFVWAGYLIVVAPILIWLGIRKRSAPPVSILTLLVATYCLTIWQARWGYFFLSAFAISLPKLLEAIKPRPAVWIAFGLALLPVLEFWDARIWPNEAELSARIERRNESRDLRELAMMMRSNQTRAFLAPWWLASSISYWSGQLAVAGSSHEALDGAIDTARFFLNEDPRTAREVLKQRRVEWVIAYDWGRVGQNSAGLLGISPTERALGRILDQAPASAPAYLVLSGQNRTAKLFRFADKL
jgi:hypothetical protein